MTTTFDFSNLPKSALTGKPVLHFAHANGMPSRCYQPLFDELATYFTIEYIPLLGATENYPVDNHWQAMTQQVIDSVSLACHKHNVTSVIGLGHSLGALCTLQAVYKHTHLFTQAIFCDPPMIYGWHNLLMHVGKSVDKLPLVDHFCLDKISPSGISRYRKDKWDNRQQARESFVNKKFFANFDKQCFELYIEHGLKEVAGADGQVTLAIPKQVEVDVFRTNPSWLWLTPNKPPTIPVTNLIGEDSLFLKYKFPQKIKKRLQIPFITHAGGHMFPLEHPVSVAHTILTTLEKNNVT